MRGYFLLHGASVCLSLSLSPFLHSVQREASRRIYEHRSTKTKTMGYHGFGWSYWSDHLPVIYIYIVDLHGGSISPKIAP